MKLGALLQKFRLHELPIRGVAQVRINPEKVKIRESLKTGLPKKKQEAIVTAAEDCTLCLFVESTDTSESKGAKGDSVQPRKWDCCKRVKVPHEAGLLSFMVSANTKFFATGGLDCKVVLGRVETIFGKYAHRDSLQIAMFPFF